MKRSWFAGPYVVWMILFTIAPLLFVAYYAFTDTTGAFTMANIAKSFEGQYLTILVIGMISANLCSTRSTVNLPFFLSIQMFKFIQCICIADSLFFNKIFIYI